MRRDLHKHGIEVKDVWLFKSGIKGTKTAKVRVAKEHRERAKAPDIWPIHCQIKDWNFSKRKEKRQDEAK